MAKISIVILLLLSAFGLILTLAGYATSFRYLEILSDYRPFLIGFGVLCLIPAIPWCKSPWPRPRTIALTLSLLVISINGLEVLPWLFAAKPTFQSTTSANEIKAIAFNVEGINTNYAGTRAFVEQEAPDIAMFCECTEQWSAELRDLTNQLPYRFRNEAMTIEVFSRYPFSRTNVFNYGPERGFNLLAISLDGQHEFGFVATHTYPRHWLGNQGFRWRTETLEKGLGKVLNDFTIPFLVMGDLNASPWSPAYKHMIKSSGLRDARRGHGLLVTQHGHGSITKWLWRPIDHCLYSPGIEVTNLSTGPDLNSDHLPIIATFRLP